MSCSSIVVLDGRGYPRVRQRSIREQVRLAAEFYSLATELIRARSHGFAHLVPGFDVIQLRLQEQSFGV